MTQMLDAATIAAIMAEEEELLPTDLGGCVLWLSDDSRLVALGQPTVAFPKDLSQSGTWARTGLASVAHGESDPDGGTSADLLTEDTSTGGHWVIQTLTGVVTGLPGTIVADCKVGTSGTRGVAIHVLGGIVYFRPSTGLVEYTSGISGTPVVRALGNGWWRVESVIASIAGSMCLVAAYSVSGSASYTGDGTSNVRVHNIRCTQDGVRYLNDRSPVATQVAPYVENAARANQPRWLASDPAFNGYPSIQFDGSDDVLATPANAVLTGHTMIWAGRLIGSSSDAGICGTGTSGYAMTHHNANTLYYYSGPGQFCQFSQGQNETLVLGARWTGDTTANGQQVWKNGVMQAQRTHSGAALTAGTFKLGRISTTTNSKTSQCALWNRALSDDEFVRIQRVLGRRIGVAIA